MWVFWIHASNKARFEYGYQEIASLVKLLDRKNPHGNIFQLVHNWLRNEAHGRWVLVLDNVDDASFLMEPYSLTQQYENSYRNPPRLLDYIPQSPHGSVLITSRTRSAALRLVEQTEIIPIEPMSEADTIALLEKKLAMQASREDLTALAQELEYMPLAIVQAAGYIGARAPRCSIQQYISKFRKHDKGRAALLNHEGGHFRRDPEAKNSIINTWQISFDHIRDTRPSAANLLSLMSFFDRQGIPEALIRDQTAVDEVDAQVQPSYESSNGHQYKEGDRDDSSSGSSITDKFEEDILLLRSYSFISIDADASTFGMHRLVQLSMRTWLAAHEQLEEFRGRFIKNLSSSFPLTEDHENWTECEALFPHVKLATEQLPQGELLILEWASLLHRAASYLREKGRGAEAAEMARKSMEARKEQLGPEHERTLESTHVLCQGYRLAGRLQVAQEMLTQLVETNNKKFGPEHRFTLRSMNDLVGLFLDQGQYSDAEELGIRALEKCNRVLGAEHQTTLTSIGNLALIYLQQGRFKKAEELEVKLLETKKRVLGAEHPGTLITIGNLASSYCIQGRFKEAEELEVELLETKKRVLGADHPDTLTATSNLAFTLKGQARDVEALKLLGECVQLQIRVLGADHPDSITSSKALARWQGSNQY